MKPNSLPRTAEPPPQTWARSARLQFLLEDARPDSPQTSAEELRLLDPGELLRTLLEPARDPSAAPAERLDAYRRLFQVLGRRLNDADLSRALHREWIRLSPNFQGAEGEGEPSLRPPDPRRRIRQSCAPSARPSRGAPRGVAV